MSVSADPNCNIPHDPDNPFPGLRAFSENETDRFFGRERQIEELATRLIQFSFVAVHGSSGCGKSSLVRAGLLAELEQRAANFDGAIWRPAVMLPGDRPIANLAQALSHALRSSDEADLDSGPIYGQLKLGGRGLADVVGKANLSLRTRVILVVDQFEELFRIRQIDPDEATAFVNLILSAARDRKSAISVVITLRSDFLGRCAEFQDLPEAINRGQYLVPKMTREQRKEAILGPVVELRSQKIAASAVQAILNDVSDAFDDLPIMQHALARTWNRWAIEGRGRREINLEDYSLIGTAANAIAQHADEVADTLPITIVEAVFRVLTELSPTGEAIRRGVSVDILCAAVGGNRNVVEQVVERFRQLDVAFLRPSPEIQLSANPTVDISHESLIRKWPLLGKWVRAEAEEVRWFRHVHDAARRYRGGQGSLLTGRDLERTGEWQRPTPEWVQLYSSGEQSAAMVQEVDEFIAESERDAKSKRDQKLLLRGGVCLLALLLFVGLFYVAYLLIHQNKMVGAITLANQALLQIDQDPARSARMALVALNMDERNSAAEFALRQSMQRLEVARSVEIVEPCKAEFSGGKGSVPTCDGVRDIRYSDDGNQLIVAVGREVVLLDAKSFRPTGVRVKRDAIVSRAWSINEGRTLVSWTEDQTVQTQQIGNDAVRSLDCPEKAAVWAVAVRQQGQQVAIGCQHGEVLVWDVTKELEEQPVELPHALEQQSTVTALNFSADGTLLASGDSKGKITVWKTDAPRVRLDNITEVVDGKRVSVALAHRGITAIRDLQFDQADADYLVSAGEDKQAIVWNLANESAQSADLKNDNIRHWQLKHERPVTFARFLPTHTKENVVFTLAGKIAQRWVDGKDDVKQRRAHDDWVLDASVSPDGKLLVTACADGTARVWSVLGGPPLAMLRGHRAGVNRAMFSRDGSAVLTASEDGSIRIWEVHAPEVLTVLEHWALAARFDPSGTRVAIGDDNGTACVMQLSRLGSCEYKLELPDYALSHFSWSRDSKYLAGLAAPNDLNDAWVALLWPIESDANSEFAARSKSFDAIFRKGGDDLLALNYDRGLLLWDAERLDSAGVEPTWKIGADPRSFGPSISPDGQWVAVSTGKEIQVWRRGSKSAPSAKLQGHRGNVRSLSFSDDSQWLVSASEDGTARIWSTSNLGESIELKGGHAGALYSASFDTTGRWVVTSGADGAISVWDATTSKLLSSLRRHSEGVNDVEFSQNGLSILSASDDGTVQLGRWGSESFTHPLQDLKNRALEVAKISKHDERALQRDVDRLSPFSFLGGIFLQKKN